MHDLSKAHASPNFGSDRIQEAGRRQQSPLTKPFCAERDARWIRVNTGEIARAHGAKSLSAGCRMNRRLRNAENGTAIQTNGQAARQMRGIAMDPGIDRATMLHMDRGADYDSSGD